MDTKNEINGLTIFLGSLIAELEKTFGTSTIKAILNRLGSKPGEVVAQTILERFKCTVRDTLQVFASASEAGLGCPFLPRAPRISRRPGG